METEPESTADLLQQMLALPDDSARRAQLRDRIVEMHMPLVIYLARRYSGRSEPMDDLVQVGCLGLLKAIDRYDPERGYAFATFATPTILGEIKRHFRDSSWLIHVPRSAKDLQTSLNAARDDLAQELGRSPTVGELAERLDLEPDAVLEALEAARAYSAEPLDTLAAAGESEPEHPALRMTDAGFERVEQRQLLRTLIDSLPDNEREVLVLRFITGRTQTEIASVLGVSQMQVSRLLARGLRHVRSGLGLPET